jgi:hypothetical protein
MIRCAVSRGSSSAKLLSATGRVHISTSKPPTLEDLEREYGISDPSFTPLPVDRRAQKDDVQATAEAADHATQQPKSTSKTVTRRRLPTSPYMDPATISAKEKYRAPKPPPSKNPTSFQKILAQNPYARALATPVRSCRATSVVLPRYFLQDFNLMLHPETKEPWWVPRSLARVHRGLLSEKEDADGEEAIAEDGAEKPVSQDDGAEDNEMQSGKESDVSEHETDNITQDKSKSSSVTSPEKLPSSSSRIGPYSYVLARQPVLAGFSRDGAFNETNFLQSSFPVKLRDQKALEDIFRSAKIRPDIDIFVLELMRRRAVEGLEYLGKLGHYILPFHHGWKGAILPSKHVGAILWTGAEQGKSNKFPENGPPEFAVTEVGTSKKRKVPVHNLDMLLGREHLQRLRETSDLFQNGLLILKHKNVTVDMLLKLWKLQGYMAEHRQFLDTDSLERQDQPLAMEEKETQRPHNEMDKHREATLVGS